MKRTNIEFEILKEHIGHSIECVGYFNEDGECVNTAIECLDCCEVLIDYDKYGED